MMAACVPGTCAPLLPASTWLSSDITSADPVLLLQRSFIWAAGLSSSAKWLDPVLPSQPLLRLHAHHSTCCSSAVATRGQAMLLAAALTGLVCMHRGLVAALVLSPWEGSVLPTSSADGTVGLWDRPIHARRLICASDWLEVTTRLAAVQGAGHSAGVEPLGGLGAGDQQHRWHCGRVGPVRGARC